MFFFIRQSYSGYFCRYFYSLRSGECVAFTDLSWCRSKIWARCLAGYTHPHTYTHIHTRFDRLGSHSAGLPASCPSDCWDTSWSNSPLTHGITGAGLPVWAFIYLIKYNPAAQFQEQLCSPSKEFLTWCSCSTSSLGAPFLSSFSFICGGKMEKVGKR